MNKILCVITICLIVMGCSYGNLDDVKAKAPEVWKQAGYEIVGYEGFQWGFGGFGLPYGGAYVWHQLKKIPDNGIAYTGRIQRWGNEYHIYGPYAIDAIRPR